MTPIGSSVRFVALGRDVSATDSDANGHVKLAAVGNRCDDMLGVDEGELGRNLEIRTGDGARTLGGHVSGRLLDVLAEGR